MDQPLARTVVVELATGVAGPYAGKLFADFGAVVTKVEPPGGDPSRWAVTIPGDRPEPEASGRFLHLNTNKRSVVLDDGDAGDVAVRDALVDAADLVISSGGPEEVAALRHGRPGLVVLSVTPFGLTGPYAGFAGEEIVAYAMGGPMHATGMAEREPLKMGGNIVQVQSGAVAAVAGLAALTLAERTGRGHLVDVAAFETQAGSIDRRAGYLLYHTFTGEPVPREGGHRAGLIPAGVYPAMDGYVQVLFAPSWLGRLADLLGDDELGDRLATPGWQDDPDVPEMLDTALHVWSLSRTKQEAMAEAQAAGLGVTALNTPLDVLSDPHLRARGWFRTVEHPVAGRYEAPGPPFRLGNAWRLRRPAPLLDEHGPEVRAAVAAGLPRRARPPADASPGLPLEGVRVLDLTVVWAGPYCTMLLGDLGAEVIRLDNPNLFPTATRGVFPRPRPGHTRELGTLWGAYPDDEPGRRPWNRVGPFVCHARTKLGATLDLRTPLGRETFLRLVERSDVLVENNSAKVLDRLGIGWDVLSARNPRLIALRMPSLGLDGPYASYIGFGAHIEALCGLTALRGYPDMDPTANAGTYHMDPASGAGGALAVLLALRRRERTGRGELIEFAQSENLLHHIGEHLIDASRRGVAHGPLGNRHPSRAPQGAYRCAGEDRWVVISVGDDAEWAGLGRAMGRPPWSADARFADADSRRGGHDELDRLIGEWTTTLDPQAVFARCQAEGVPCGIVLDEAGCLADPHLAARGFFRRNGSPSLGEHVFPGHLWKWDGPPMRWGPINEMGADNTYVYRELLGLDDAEWAALQAEGHLSLDYVDADGNPL